MPEVAPRVAIACQGGGSHAAFAAGVLHGLLTRHAGAFDLKGISGTSGGAMCAALVWAGLIAGGPAEADRRLMAFWNELKADDLQDFWTNLVGQTVAHLPFSLEVSPYLLPAPAADIMRGWLREHLRLADLPPPSPDDPKLIVGATDVERGERVVIHDHDVTEDALIGSAAVPFLYKAVPFGDRNLWDGLFSVNPPIRDLVDLPIDELWVIQINPQTSGLPTRTSDIIDRRNELSGNVALAQELHFVDKINRMIEHGEISAPVLEKGTYRHIKIRVLDAGLRDKDYASKLDRSPALINELLTAGANRAADFFHCCTNWPREGHLPARAVRIA